MTSTKTVSDKAIANQEGFRLYQANPSIKLRNQLVLDNQGLATEVAHEVWKKSFIPYEDLRQLAIFSLIDCVERFDPYKGYQFSSYAIPKIRGKLLNWVRDKGHVIKIPRTYFDLNQKAKRAEIMLTKQGSKPTAKEVADYLKIDLALLITSKSSFTTCRFFESVATCSDISIIESLKEDEELNISLENLTDVERQALILFFDNKRKLSDISKILQMEPDHLKVFLRMAVQKALVSRMSEMF